MLLHVPRHRYPRPPAHKHSRPTAHEFPNTRKGGLPVTAIAGFRCVDGVVLAADTEESYGNDNKAYAHKLFPVDRPQSRLCVAGSGLGYLIDYANEQIVSALDSGIANETEFYVRLGDILEQAYAEDGKFMHFPVNEPIESRIDLLIAVQFTDESDSSKWLRPTLFECRSNLVTKIEKSKQSCLIGVGEVLKQVGTQLAGWGLNTKLAEWASMYIIHDAKRRFGGVGGKTHLFTMRTDGTFFYDRGISWHEKEAVFDALPRAHQLITLSLCVGAVTDSKAHDFVRGVEEWVMNTREHLSKVEQQGGKAKHERISIPDSEMEAFVKSLQASMPSTSQKSEPEQ